MKVFITQDIPSIAYSLLKKNKIEFEVYQNDSTIPHNVLLNKIKNVDGLIALLTERIDKEVIDTMTNCKIVAQLPLNEKTYHLFNKENLSMVKNSAIIINTSRGELIDEQQIIRMLKEKKLYSVGLEVFENEH